MRDGAYRRHQWRRAKLRAIRHLRWLWPAGPGRPADKAIARLAVDRVPCSCWMCGNPRHFTGEVTRQERLAARRHDESEA